MNVHTIGGTESGGTRGWAMIQPQQIIIRLVVATVLGAIVGLERERLERAAGLRTHALVGVGAALFMLVSAFGFADVLGTRQVALDPSRIAAQVVSGIGFLGAGTIILQREIIRGLTTAASVWAVAAVGLAVGGGLYLAAVSATVLILHAGQTCPVAWIACARCPASARSPRTAWCPVRSALPRSTSMRMLAEV
jgi:uncharacterized membrane protein YhiD involved in acid resistance